MKIGANIRSVRVQKNYSQEYMAACLGISQSYYARIENDQMDISLTRLVKIAQTLEVSISKLLPLELMQQIQTVSHSQVGNGQYIDQRIQDAQLALYESQLNHLKQEIEFLRQITSQLSSKS